MIISDGQLASKMFHYERARWDLISALSLRAAAQASSARGITFRSPGPELTRQH